MWKLLAAVLALVSVPLATAHDNGGGRGSYRFIEGAWKTTLTWTDCWTGFRVGGPAQGLMTLAADGSVVESGPALDGIGNPVGTHRSAGQGRWERTGRDTFKLIWGYYLYDERGFTVAEVPHYGATYSVGKDSNSFSAAGRHQYTPFQEGQPVGGTCWRLEGTRLDF
jgi:hypothetical protein